MDDPSISQYLSSGRRLSFDPRLIKILVVDDEMVSRLVLKRLLEKSGYADITLVDSASEALRLLQQGSTYHLIMSDVKMPVMSGVDFLKELQKDQKLSAIPVIMVSALDELQLVYQCLQNGACDFLVKPVKHGMVHNLWQNVWRKRREKKLLDMYQREQGERTKSEVELKQEIDTLQHRVSEAVTTPLKAISSALIKLMNDGTLTESVRETLAGILKQMQGSQLYKPVVQDFLVDKSGNLDDQTRAWFEREFLVTTNSSSSSNSSSASSSTSSSSSSTSSASSSTASASADSTFSFATNPQYSSITEQIRQWEFNIWEVSNEEHMFLMFHSMFKEFDLLTHYKISDLQFRLFLGSVRKFYHDKNPYHNFRHAFDVTQMIYLLLLRAQASQYLEKLELFTLLLCGILHDVDHPGLNNTFQIVTESNLALRYNDQSVLENHHCSSGFNILNEHKILAAMDVKERTKFRKLMIELILATDLARHMKALTDFDAFLEAAQKSPEGVLRTNEEHRTMISKMIMKAADLSNPAKPFPIAKYWAELIQEEFFLQGDQEKSLSLTISPFMERGKSSLPQMQINFAGFIVIPLFQVLAKLLPEVQKVTLPILLDNRQRWTEILKAEDYAKSMFNQ